MYNVESMKYDRFRKVEKEDFKNIKRDSCFMTSKNFQVRKNSFKAFSEGFGTL